jgi:cell wall-associated NlpC family hydrolase
MTAQIPTIARRSLTTLTLGLVIFSAGAGVASAVTAGATQTVTIRTGASATAPVIGGLVKGQRIPTSGKIGTSWVKVRFAGKTAYVTAKSVNTTGKHLLAGPKKIKTNGTKIATATLNVRTGPTSTSHRVGRIAEGHVLTVTGKMSGGYAQIRFRSKARWVSMIYLASTPATTVPPVTSPPPVVTPPVTPPTTTTKGETALAYAKKQLGKPYKFGATGPKSFDCSGLALMSWKSAGKTLPRTALQQSKVGKKIAKADLRIGDLVFFYGPKPHHVGIYAGDGNVIHAPQPGKKVSYIKMSYMPYAGARRPG